MWHSGVRIDTLDTLLGPLRFCHSGALIADYFEWKLEPRHTGWSVWIICAANKKMKGRNVIVGTYRVY